MIIVIVSIDETWIAADITQTGIAVFDTAISRAAGG